VTAAVLRLAGPLQSWGASSRFVRRTTEPQPTRSGVLGLLAAAMGRRRTDPIEDLVGLALGVRVDQPGELVRDFQTARTLDGTHSMPLSYRYYLADAVFLAVVEGEASLVEAVVGALRRPQFPLYLGRRSCPPVGPVLADVVGTSVWETLSTYPWQASAAVRRRHSGPVVVRDVALDRDCAPDDVRRGGDEVVVRDEPISFDPELRQYGWRAVVRAVVELPTGATGDDGTRHDAMAILGG
jgi:CRISPR system Cascade subunit CasD